MSAQEVDIDALVRGRRRPRRWLLLVALLAVAVIAVLIWYFTQPEDDVLIAEPQQLQAVSARLTTTAALSGTAAAANGATLSFAEAGVVASVEVSVGERVSVGAVLATLDDGAARRRLETAEVQLRLAQLRLDELREDPVAADIAAAERAIAAAESQVVSAELTLQRLSEPPDNSEIVAAEQAVANARSQLSAADQSLADLTSEIHAADLAAAEQAVASALSQLSGAEQTLTNLTSGPSDADLAAAEQAVASARSQLSGAEQTLTNLTSGASEADLATARSNVAAAKTQLNNARTQAVAADKALEDELERYCDMNRALEEICDASVPLTTEQMVFLEVESEDVYDNLRRRAEILIEAHSIRESAITTEQSALASLEATELRMQDLLTPATDDEIFQAEQAAAAAEANRDASLARRTDLLSPATEDELSQAQQAVSAARASHNAAAARLDELLADADADAVYGAQQAVAAARANRDAALARQQELLAPPTDDDIRQAEAALDSARSSLAEAHARFDELLSGSTATQIELQVQNVRLAEISLEDARAALDELLILAPFAGVIEELNIDPGDQVTTGTNALVLSTRNRIVIDLTVTEAEWFELEAGQVGLASFDAIDNLQYAVRIASVGRVPEVQQGVVTYSVEAAMLTPGELPAVQNELASIGGRGAVTIGAEGATGGGGGAAINPQARAALEAFAAQVTLPAGVDIIDVVRALAFDEPLPEGVVLPDGFEIPQQFKARLRSGFEAADRREAEREAAGDVGAPLPAPGMSASVTILTAIRPEAVQVSTSAVRQIDGAFYVALPTDAGGWERVAVEIGESDGSNVEILSGLEVGATVLVGADTEGIAFAATQLSSGPAAAGGSAAGAGQGAGAPRGGGQ